MHLVRLTTSNQFRCVSKTCFITIASESLNISFPPCQNLSQTWTNQLLNSYSSYKALCMNHQLCKVILDSQESIHHLFYYIMIMLYTAVLHVSYQTNYLVDMTFSPTRLFLELPEARNHVFPCCELSDWHTAQGTTSAPSIFVDLNNSMRQRVNWWIKKPSVKILN